MAQMCSMCGGLTLGSDVCYDCRLKKKAELADELAAALQFLLDAIAHPDRMSGVLVDRAEAALVKYNAQRQGA